MANADLRGMAAADEARGTVSMCRPTPGTAGLSVNGKKVAEGRIARTNAFIFSLDEGADVGVDEDTPVTEACQAGASSRFTGKVDRVTIQVR